METEALKDKHHKPDLAFEITINSKAVTVHSHRMTGLEIKQAALAAGLNIRLEFLLFQVFEHHPQKKVDDGETISVKKGDEFDCVGGDDNS